MSPRPPEPTLSRLFDAKYLIVLNETEVDTYDYGFRIWRDRWKEAILSDTLSTKSVNPSNDPIIFPSIL